MRKASFLSTATGLLIATTMVTAGCSHPSGTEVAPLGGADESLIGGRPARAGELDATVRINGTCTGTKVGPRHILTAAHCMTSAFAPGASVEVTNAKAYGRSSSGRASSLRSYTIESVQLEPTWKATCIGSCAALQVGGRTRMADAAVVVTTMDITGIPVAAVDLAPLADGELVTMAGYGCESSVNDLPDVASGRLRVAQTRTAGFGATVHEGSFLYPSDVASGLVDVMKTIYAITPGPGMAGGVTVGLPAPAPSGGARPGASPAPVHPWFPGMPHDFGTEDARVSSDVTTGGGFPWFPGMLEDVGTSSSGAAGTSTSSSGGSTTGAGAEAPGGGLCPGDSGGPLYRNAGAAPVVVGIHANYTFSQGEFYFVFGGGYRFGGSPTTNWHTRLDSTTGLRVGAWLRSLGVATVCSSGRC